MLASAGNGGLVIALLIVLALVIAGEANRR
jgi:hypothetical protein